VFETPWERTKIRNDDTRVFPPLPPDSPLLIDWSVDGEDPPDNAIYSLRPWPTAGRADSELEDFDWLINRPQRTQDAVTPAARATAEAIWMSWTATPVESKTVIWSSDVRRKAVPAMTSPSSIT